MSARAERLAAEPEVPPGDDVVPVPPPVDEQPPHDRFCDLVLTGGVASGVVYPWAIVELARSFRFRNIGGTSVGAMAAALAAAAEYGRRQGFEAPFEVLRRAPASLAATQADGGTRMLSLFQTNRQGQRLIRLWGMLGRGSASPKLGLLGVLGSLLRVYRRAALLGAALGLALILGLAQHLACWIKSHPKHAGVLLFLGVLLMLLGATAVLVWQICMDIRKGLIANEYGLCKGGSTGFPLAGATGIVEWLHKGIQVSAGLDINDDRPLTFRDLWSAPLYPGGPQGRSEALTPEAERSINLQMITTNVTHGRPYRLPLTDSTSRLFYKPEEWEGYFPSCVLKALHESSRPYEPLGTPGSEPAADHWTAQGLRELPGADLPIVVAARLSLSFPLLFSAVPLWAIDYEVPRPDMKKWGGSAPANVQRVLRRCIFSDGGVSSNFPVHLFDAALPRWPTFGFWLDRRSPYCHSTQPGRPCSADGKGAEQQIWLPDLVAEGRGDNWNRFDPQSAPPVDHAQLRPHAQDKSWRPACFREFGPLLGFLGGLLQSATDWRDRTNFRLPHVRNRVVRMLLLPGEGGLHIGMPREQILRMAHDYGTAAGRAFVERYAADAGDPPKPAWTEQRWLRFKLMLDGLRERLSGLSTSAAGNAYTPSLQEAIVSARLGQGPLRDRDARYRIDRAQAEALDRALDALGDLEDVLGATAGSCEVLPQPELRLRAPL